MTVNTVETRKTYNGNGTTDAFAAPYFLADGDLVVYVDNVLQTITTHYTVAGAGVPAGGTVTFVTPPPSGSGNVVIIVDPELTQLTDWVENDRNGAEVKETAFDKLTLIAQRQKDKVERAVRLADDDPGAGMVLPLPAARASTYAAFDSVGDLVFLPGTDETPGALTQINDIATLRTVNPTSGRVVYLKYHTTQGGGGHGVFEAMTGAAAGTYTDDDWRTIVHTGGDGSSCWRRKLVDESTVSAEVCGAVGDADKSAGTGTDDTDAINAGLNFAQVVRFEYDKTYLYNGLYIKGSRYKGFVNTRLVDQTRTSVFDAANKEYINAVGEVCKLEPRAPVLNTLSTKTHDWDISQFARAINGGAATVTFVGTSITEGYVSQAEHENIWVNQFKQKLRAAFPDVTFTFNNLGLASRLLSYYVDPLYVALAAEPADKSTGFYRDPATDAWPDGSTLGKSWQDHAEDTAPDLFVIHMGMNDDPGVADHVYATNLRYAITDAQSWATPPTIALVTEMGSRAANSNREEQEQSFSRVTRYIARTHNVGLIDVHRQWNMLRYGVDECDYVMQRLTTIADWEESAAFDVHTAAALDNTSATLKNIIKRGNYNGLRMSCTFTPDSVTAICGIAAHINADTTYAENSLVILRRGTVLRIYNYSGNTGHEFTGLAAVAAGVPEALDFRIVENRVEFFKDAAYVGAYHMEDIGYYGGVAIVLSEGDLAGIEVDVSATKIVGEPVFDDEDLIGRLDKTAAWDIGDYEDGGNNLNHPSRLGLIYGFGPPLDTFVSEMVAKTSTGYSGIYTPTLTNVANVDASTAYPAQYMRVGDTVTVSGQIDIDPTTASVAVQVGVSLPISSTISAAGQCAGVAMCPAIAGESAAVVGDVANDRAEVQYTPSVNTNSVLYYTYTYSI